MAKPKKATKAKKKVAAPAKKTTKKAVAKAAPKKKTKKAVAKAAPKTKPKTKPAPKAPKAPKPAKAPKQPRSAGSDEMEQADLMVMDGMNVPDKAERAANVEASKGAPSYDRVKQLVLDLFQSVFAGSESEAEILQTDPNDFDMDPSPFYEMLTERFGLSDIPGQDYFGGYGGKIEHTIAMVAKHWDGKSGSAAEA